ncbi:hypothetical protein KQX54_006814 [Cotesia glomerata]|uniref:Uncharacterized protein n=1 Tax=Cotesia glomerata TaxID=32391 RepID=A0AAV7I1X3_COTGL|nr:hypothetical protein KQX54_006814 [Cotesia glomerata]
MTINNLNNFYQGGVENGFPRNASKDSDDKASSTEHPPRVNFRNKSPQIFGRDNIYPPLRVTHVETVKPCRSNDIRARTKSLRDRTMIVPSIRHAML